MLVSLYSCLASCFYISQCVLCFWIFCLLVCGSFAPNEAIVRSRCGGGEPCSWFLKKNLKIFLLLVVFGSSVLFFIGFDPLNLDY